MGRALVAARQAEPSDAPALAELWSDALRRVDHEEQVLDLEAVLAAARRADDQRCVVADYDGELAGAVLLRLTTLSPLNPEPCVQAVHPRVFPRFRRRGVGRALMECAVVFADDHGVGHLSAAVPASARDANRFMARLAFGPQATTRVVPTAVVAARLAATRPVPATQATRPAGGGRQLTRVLAARRSMRRAQEAAEAGAAGTPGPAGPFDA